MMTDSVELLTGVSILILTPALVELAKQLGLATRWAGMAAILLATSLVMLSEIALGTPRTPENGSRWLMSGIVYGLAAAGLYSQARMRDDPPLAPA